jgi:plastocyanin
MESTMRNVIVCLLTAAALTGCGGQQQTETAQREAETAPARPDAGPPPPAEAPVPAVGTAGQSTISGTITYSGKVPELKPINMGADPGCAAKHRDPAVSEALVLGPGNTVGNVLVHVKSGLPQRSGPVPAEPVVMDQEGCRYKPHVMGVMVGQAFKILNSDGLLHNVHALPQANREFNMAMPASRTEAEERFTKREEPFKIKCDVHPWMNAYVAVFEHPYYTVTLPDGKFSIASLPAGTYEIEVWHERLPAQTASVTVGGGESKTQDFTLTM